MIVALDAGCPDNKSTFCARSDVYGVARVQQPQHVVQFQFGRVEAHNLPTDASELRPIAFGAHATAVHDCSSIGELTSGNECLPMTLDTSFLKSDGNRLKECAIIHLGITWKI